MKEHLHGNWTARASRTLARGTMAAWVAVGIVCLTGCPQQEKPSTTIDVRPWSVDLANDQLTATIALSSGTTEGGGQPFAANTEAPWIAISPETGLVPDGGSPVDVTIRVTRALMRPGSNEGVVVFRVAEGERHTVTVRAEATLAADFLAAPTLALVNEPIAFSDASNVLTGGAPISRWKWDFGDGTTSGDRNPVHTYRDRGRYTVRFQVWSANHTDIRERRAYIHVRAPQGPIADFVVATTRPVMGIPVEFTSTALPGTAPITTWHWDFGDGTTSAAERPVHIYQTASVFDVFLTVKTRIGTDTTIKLGYIDVQPASAVVPSRLGYTSRQRPSP